MDMHEIIVYSIPGIIEEKQKKEELFPTHQKFTNTDIPNYSRDKKERKRKEACTLSVTLGDVQATDITGHTHTQYHTLLTSRKNIVKCGAVPQLMAYIPLQEWWSCMRHSGCRTRSARCHAPQGGCGDHSYRLCGTTSHMQCT